ncbi:TetR/AcrR family transcriptional regulator, partial [Weissella paramesenteroides]
MVSKTFENLAEEKQLRIRHALLKEFSTYSLAEAQVARIVADSGIA